MQQRRQRRRIEIYFVLYLVALVLLMPDASEQGTGAGTVMIDRRLRLELRPDRLNLSCEVQRDTAGQLRLVQIDSVNIIHIAGDVRNVSLRARIEDDRTGQVTMIEATPAGQGGAPALFELIPQPERQAVAFYWRPYVADITEHKFRVTIFGSAEPVGSQEGALPAGLRISGSTQFVVETHVVQQQPNMELKGTIIDTVLMAPAPLASSTPVGRGTFWVAPASTTIRTTPSALWTNRLSFGGADPVRDLRSLPRVRVSSQGVAVERFFDSLQQVVILRGRAPASGSYTVTVIAERDDGQTTETQFDVEAVRVERLQLPKVVYAGSSYQLNTKLPDVNGARAVVRVNGEVVATTSENVIQFSVPRTSVGATLSVERLIGNDRVDAPVTQTIAALPAPEIRDVRTAASGSVKRVVVLFYGDRNRDRPTLDVVSGNAQRPQKLFGNLRPANPDDPNGIAWIEEFDIKRSSGDAPFHFVIRAKDGRGMVSALWTEQ